LRKNLSLAWPLAALGIASTIIAFFLGIQFAIGNGTQLMVGRIASAGDADGLRRTLSDGVLISVTAALLFFMAISLFGDSLIALLTRDEQLRTQAGIYLAITRYLLIASAISQTFTVFLNGQGDTKTPFKVYLLEVPFNTVVSYLLIFGVQSLSFDGLGVAGAALGSLAAVLFR